MDKNTKLKNFSESLKLSASGVGDFISPSALEITSKDIAIGSKISKTFFIISYPSTLNSGWLSSIINLNHMFDLSININPVETASAMRDFRKKVAEVESQIADRANRGLVRDPKLDAAYQNLEYLRGLLQRSEERIFGVGLYITLYADTREEMKSVEEEFKNELESRLIYVRVANFQQKDGFRTTAPLGMDLLSVHTTLNTGPLSSFFPFLSFNLSSNEGILYGVNRHNNSLILFDRFSLPNYNSTTFAKSGGGKSYAIKLEALRSLMFGIDVIVIDPEKEFESLARAVDGRSFNISLSSEHKINPFDLPPVGEDETPADVLRSNIITLISLFRLLLGGLTSEEESLLDRAINETYALKDITPEKDFSNTSPPLLSDLALVLSGIEGAESLSKRITKYTQGSWSEFINKPSNINMNKQMIVFSIRDMEDDLKPAAMFLIANFIWHNVKKNIKKRLLIVDEAWVIMKSEDTASFLYGLVKRGRKYYLGVATITQDVEDFLGSKYGRPILTNSSLQLLLKQSTASINIVQEVFNLTNSERSLLLEAGVGEGIFIAGLKRVAIQVVSSYTEHQIVTSDPSHIIANKANEQK